MEAGIPAKLKDILGLEGPPGRLNVRRRPIGGTRAASGYIHSGRFSKSSDRGRPDLARFTPIALITLGIYDIPMRISVVIPVFNEAATVAGLYASVLATGLADEIILVNDGSSDATPRILDALP